MYTSMGCPLSLLFSGLSSRSSLLPRPFGNTPPNAAQETAGRLGHQGTLLACFPFGVHQDTQILFCKALFQLASPQHILVHGLVPPQVQDFSILLAELDDVPFSPFLQPSEVPPGSRTSSCVSATPPSFLSSANLLRVRSAPSSNSLMEMLKNIGPSIDPRVCCQSPASNSCLSMAETRR